MSELTTARIRRAKGDLRISGLAYMAFGIWEILKVAIEIGTGIIDPFGYAGIDQYDTRIVFLTALFSLASISAIILIIHFYVGFSSLRFSKNPSTSKLFLILSVLLIVYYCIELPAMLYGAFNWDQRVDDTTIASVLFELTSIFILIDVIRSGWVLKKSVEESPKET
jgi:hypothetical protein